MKKTIFAVILGLCGTCASADYYETYHDNCDPESMHAALEQAVATGRAVITVVKCDESAMAQRPASMAVRPVRMMPAPRAVNSDCGFEQVVNREYFVRETVQQYRPVVSYVPSGTYVRTRPACDECGM